MTEFYDSIILYYLFLPSQCFHALCSAQNNGVSLSMSLSIFMKIQWHLTHYHTWGKCVGVKLVIHMLASMTKLTEFDWREGTCKILARLHDRITAHQVWNTTFSLSSPGSTSLQETWQGPEKAKQESANKKPDSFIQRQASGVRMTDSDTIAMDWPPVRVATNSCQQSDHKVKPAEHRLVRSTPSHQAFINYWPPSSTSGLH